MERAVWQEQGASRRGEEKWQTSWCCRDQRRACRMTKASAEKLLTYWACRKEKSGLSAKKRAVGKYARGAFAKREREQSHLLRYQIVRWERIKVRESRTLARKRKIGRGAWGENDGLYGKERQVSRRKGRASKKSLLRRSRRKHERVSGR